MTTSPKPTSIAGVKHEGTYGFGAGLRLDAYIFNNGLRVLLCEDHSAPVVAYHTWYRVGSRHEHQGKTGLAHLFEHLMFNETENLGPGVFDRTLEEAGAESNAATWLDWTQYNIAVPTSELALVAKLESERMTNLVLREPQVESEKEVVANERRYRVDDDVDGRVSELLWSTAFTRHGYSWPTIGWMRDIQNFNTQDCEQFYSTYYAPNNATIVVVGDTDAQSLLPLLSEHYAALQSASVPLEDVRPEPPQTERRVSELPQPVPTEKLSVGFKSPALGDADHLAVTVLAEVLFGGRASRAHRRLLRDDEIATDVRAFVSPFHDPGLIEITATCRDDFPAERIESALNEEIERLKTEPPSVEEIERATARLELGQLSGLETVDGKASTIGYYDTVLGEPDASLRRVDALRRVTRNDLLRVARRYLVQESSTVVYVRKSAPEEAS